MPVGGGVLLAGLLPGEVSDAAAGGEVPGAGAEGEVPVGGRVLPGLLGDEVGVEVGLLGTVAAAHEVGLDGVALGRALLGVLPGRRVAGRGLDMVLVLRPALLLGALVVGVVLAVRGQGVARPSSGGQVAAGGQGCPSTGRRGGRRGSGGAGPSSSRGWRAAGGRRGGAGAVVVGPAGGQVAVGVAVRVAVRVALRARRCRRHGGVAREPGGLHPQLPLPSFLRDTEV